jgi:membrane-bound ClpP family serine protease
VKIFKNIIEGVKNFKNIPGRVYLRYTLFQIPGLALAVLLLWWLTRFFPIPLFYICTLLGLWLLKDIMIFPFVWHSYDNTSGNVLEKMIGKTGTAINDLNPFGYVRIGGEMWKAEIIQGNRAVGKGEPVVVTGVDGLLLTVKSADI